MSPAIQIRLLAPSEIGVLSGAAEGVFDRAVDPELAREFLADPRHHIVVALEDARVIGFVSALDYVHPDKPRELWLNEASVAPGHRRTGLATRLITAMLDHARARGCQQAWVLTERSNGPALGLYLAVGGEEPEHEVVMFEFDLSRITDSSFNSRGTEEDHVGP